METENMKRKKLLRPVIPCLLAAVLLAGCSGIHPFGPKRAKGSQFLRKVQSQCGNLTIGGLTVNSMFSINTSEPLFFSWTSALGAGDISKKKYAKSINGYYQNSNNDRVISCIIRQVDGGNGQ